MTVLLARTELSRSDLRLFLSNSEGYSQDAASVRYTVKSFDGNAASGNRLPAIKYHVGEYYAPWNSNVPNGAYQIIWEIKENPCDCPKEIVQNVFVVDPSSYVCGPNGLPKAAIPPQGSGTFLSGSVLEPTDLPLYLKDLDGFPADAFAVYWTIFNSANVAVTPKTNAIRIGVGQYYAAWQVISPTGDYYISWEFMRDSTSPFESARMPFSIVCASNPVAQSFSKVSSSCCSPMPSSASVCCINTNTCPMTNCSIPIMPPVTPSSGCCIEIARTIHLATGVLPSSGQFTSQPVYNIPPKVRDISFYINYSRGASGGFPTFRLYWGNGVEEVQETLVNEVIIPVLPSNSAQALTLLEFDGPPPQSNDPINFIIYVAVPGGSTTVRLRAAEKGVPGSPGIVGITLTASG